MVAYEPVADYVSYKMTCSKKPEVVPDFSGPGTFQFYLLDDTERFIDIQMSHQTMINGLKFSMADDKAIQKFTLFVRETAIQFPSDFSEWGIHRLHYGDLPSDTSPQIITRTIMFQPIMCDVVRIKINEGAEEIQGAVEILGMPNKKVYKADPIFEPRYFESEFFLGSRSGFNQYVTDRGVCPGGGIIMTFYVEPAATYNYQCKVLIILIDFITMKHFHFSD